MNTLSEMLQSAFNTFAYSCVKDFHKFVEFSRHFLHLRKQRTDKHRMSGTVGFQLIKDEHRNEAENLLLHHLSTQKDTHIIIGSIIEIYRCEGYTK
jgi:hypothetical protein